MIDSEVKLTWNQGQRLKRRLQADGPHGLFNGNTALPPAKGTADVRKEQGLDLATTYAQFNFSHLAGILAEEHAIFLSDETLRRWLRPLGRGRSLQPDRFPWQRLGDWNEQPARGWVEGAWMFKRNGTYYLTYAAAGTATEDSTATASAKSVGMK